ncbi:hypothetical protein EBI_24075 [Enterocytozoon bieneusi H348]|nr:hypothetical protein EBI_24075 [Enterocytozoon bieneusi H348]|eukprot:XP_002652143.1 hypothetical protein EBI_24075 [Enterocytozoon bieneusi H348]
MVNRIGDARVNCLDVQLEKTGIDGAFEHADEVISGHEVKRLAQKAEHDHVCGHPVSEVNGYLRGGDLQRVLNGPDDLGNKLGVNNENAVLVKGVDILFVCGLEHCNQQIFRLGNGGVDGLVLNDELSLTLAASCLRAVGLRLDRVKICLRDRGGAEDHGGEDNALSAESAKGYPVWVIKHDRSSLFFYRCAAVYGSVFHDVLTEPEL